MSVQNKHGDLIASLSQWLLGLNPFKRFAETI
jgi:hypothetical protein